ncbi:DUF4186 domain-containing protein [Candidatus Velamenicoccus archaeovorus]|uniref:DUF4186 domain-containing protein n=1 Tax=Velamenicoccus archaeovorus TaxID=1930593 RepID=A0A410P2X4_VELA1|nr:DUF4186 domain-containing protein [Candidatus Velamenicoccus archaeovorus]QAT16374.1 DUF4186 domain-containing protein [Candidatus Velamenicoccus archaeovorus]
MNESHESIFNRLKGSHFRSHFRLKDADVTYIEEKGIETIRRHACEFIAARIAPRSPADDGRQTPFSGHPVFVAQHATGTCCRSCLEKWHKIRQGIMLNEEHQDFIVKLIMAWIEKERTAGALRVKEEK